MQPGDSSTRPSASTRSNGSSVTRRSEHGWTMPVDFARSGKRVLVVGAGPSGLSAAYHLTRLGHQVTSAKCGRGRRDDAVRHPGVPASPRRRSTPRSSGSLDLGVRPRARHPGDRSGRGPALGASTRSSWPSARTSAAAPTSRPATPRGSSTRCRCWPGWPKANSRCSAAGSRCTAAGTPRWTSPARLRRLGATDAVVVYRRTRDRMPAHDIEVTEAVEEGVRMRWLSHHHVRRRRDGSRSRRWPRRDRLPAADRRVRGARG